MSGLVVGAPGDLLVALEWVGLGFGVVGLVAVASILMFGRDRPGGKPSPVVPDGCPKTVNGIGDVNTVQPIVITVRRGRNCLVTLTRSAKGILFMGVAGAVLMMSSPAYASTAPNPGPTAPPGLDTAANTFLGWLKWGGLVGGVVGLFICGLMMMLGRRNRSTTAVDGATGIPWVLGGLTLMSFAASITGAVLS